MSVETESFVEVKSEERWQLNIKSLPDGLRHVYETGEFSDILFIITNPMSNNKTKFKAHRLFLGARSNKFREMLLGQDPPLEIGEVCSEVGFEILLRFIYTDELGTEEENKILEAFRVAKKFEQLELISKCKELISNWEINDKNVCTLLNKAPDIDFLVERCLQFAKENSETVLNSEDLLSATPNTLRDFFKHKCFDNVAVGTLQTNVIRWCSNQFPEINYERVRELLLHTEILGKLKIQNMTQLELTEFICKYPNLLTPVEYQQFMVARLPGKPEGLPLPEWCFE